MLTIHQSKLPRTNEVPAIGLAIAGGGPLGAIYELGALRAMDEAIPGLRMDKLDVYVGISAGALIASCLANGFSSAELCRVFIGTPHAQFKFDPERLLRPAYSEYLKRAAQIPGAIARLLQEYIRHPFSSTTGSTLNALGKIVPTGIFDNTTIDRFLNKVFSQPGRSNDFRELKTRLIVLAVDLDSGELRRFGSDDDMQVPISTAVQASAALPGLFPPVRIDGHDYVDGALRRTMHGSAALDEGLDLLLGINPLVPYHSRRKKSSYHLTQHNLVEGGLPQVISQTYRAILQSRMRVGFSKYRRNYPESDLLLQEPDREDEAIFYTNLFSFSSRYKLIEHAYQATRENLLENRKQLKPLLARYGYELDIDLLQKKQHTIRDSMKNDRGADAPVAIKLKSVLDDLDDTLRHIQHR